MNRVAANVPAHCSSSSEHGEPRSTDEMHRLGALRTRKEHYERKDER
jgi:hypothetical protein